MALTRKAGGMEELITRKFKELELTVASKENIEELKQMIIDQNNKIQKQSQEILLLQSIVATQEQEISKMNDGIAYVSKG